MNNEIKINVQAVAIKYMFKNFSINCMRQSQYSVKSKKK